MIEKLQTKELKKVFKDSEIEILKKACDIFVKCDALSWTHADPKQENCFISSSDTINGVYFPNSEIKFFNYNVVCLTGFKYNFCEFRVVVVLEEIENGGLYYVYTNYIKEAVKNYHSQNINSVKTCLLINAGGDFESEKTNIKNYRLRFSTTAQPKKADIIYKEIVIDFSTTLDQMVGSVENKKMEFSKNNVAVLFCDVYYTCFDDDCYGSLTNKEIIEMCPALDVIKTTNRVFIKASIENIKIILENIFGVSIENINCVDSEFFEAVTTKEESFYNINVDFSKYERCLKFKEIAQNKIKEIKKGVRYDNTSYYYKNNVFNILIHYNCYNDILKFKLDNIDDLNKAINAINNYTIPEKEIKDAISKHGISSNKLYI